MVALTGGIASGKTAVADRFAALGACVVDTDVIAREVVEPGQPALDAIRAGFGADVFGSDGRLDRRALRRKVFSDPAERRRLEALLHPLIRKSALQRIGECTAPYCLLVIPLLAEAGGFPGIDRVLLVTADREVRKQRLMARDGVSGESAEAAMAAQASDEEREAIADDIIDNTGPEEALAGQVRNLHREYLHAARSSVRPG